MAPQWETERMQTVLVVAQGRAGEDRALALLCETLNPKVVRLRIAHALLVPSGVPLYVAMPAAEDQSVCIVKHAQEIAHRYGITAETVVIRGRTVAECVAEEAAHPDVGAVWILFREHPAPWGHRFVRETLTTLMHSVPCPIMIVHLPHSRAEGPGRRSHNGTHAGGRVRHRAGTVGGRRSKA
jgi:nucleotide-binding universal stress UspA family protein